MGYRKYRSGGQSASLTKMSLSKLRELEKKINERLDGYRYDLSKLGNLQPELNRLARSKQEIERLYKDIQLEHKNLRQKSGLIASFLGTKELTPEAKLRVSALQLQLHEAQVRNSSISTNSVMTYEHLKGSIETQENYLQKVVKQIERIERKKDSLESLKNKASESVKEKRDIAKSVKRRLASNTECPYCGDFLDSDAHADHIYPVSKGGESRAKNMVLVCATCNLKKGKLTLQGFIRKYNLDRDEIEARLESMGKEF